MTTFRAMAAALALGAFPAEARPPELERAMAGAQLVGEARYQLLTWTLFDAALWSEDGDFSWERPFALTLTYRQAFSSRSLVDRSIVEMSRRGVPASGRLGALLRECFPDVAPGDRITGLSTGPDSAVFLHNGRHRCAIEWPGFRRAFFGIWLDASGSQEAFSSRLRGTVNGGR